MALTRARTPFVRRRRLGASARDIAASPLVIIIAVFIPATITLPRATNTPNTLLLGLWQKVCAARRHQAERNRMSG
jgi:hypothetical protein